MKTLVTCADGMVGGYLASEAVRTDIDTLDETDRGKVAKYGQSRLAGERFVTTLVPRSYIVRAGWMIGGGPGGEKKFIARMLERAERKASERGLVIDFVVGPAEEPPLGSFDVVMARHLLWTLPEPSEALTAWRRAVRGESRLVLFEGSWAGEGPWVRAMDAIASSAERLMRVHDDHHAPYPSEVVERLPLQGASSPAPFVEAVRSAGWSRIRLARLRDVEWSIERRAPWPLGRLRRRPRYAIVAES